MLPKSQRLLAGCADGVLRAYSLASYNLHREWPGHQGAIHDVAVGRDESVAWTAGMDGSIRAWSLNS
jgi:WD40 repeat protein